MFSIGSSERTFLLFSVRLLYQILYVPDNQKMYDLNVSSSTSVTLVAQCFMIYLLLAFLFASL